MPVETSEQSHSSSAKANSSRYVAQCNTKSRSVVSEAMYVNVSAGDRRANNRTSSTQPDIEDSRLDIAAGPSTS